MSRKLFASILIGALLGIGAPPSAHAGADDVVDSSKSFVMENFSSYHGTKPGYVDSIQKGIQKPKSGTQGNYDDDWKGFYSTDNKYDAAGYSVDNENPLSGKAGGVVKVTYPGLTKVLALKVDNAETIKKELGLSLTEPLMEQVGTEEFIKRFGDGASRVVLSLPFAEGSSSVEYINNWEQAKALSVELEINFETRGKRGQDAMYEYMAQACAGNRVRRSVGSSLSCINLDWDAIRDKTKTKIESLKEHGPIKNKMSESPNKAVSEEKAKQYLEEFHQTALEHPELSELKTVTGTNPVFAGANYAAWAVNVAQVIDSETADNLEKTTAALSILPGIGSVMGIADGAVHHNTEEIVAQSIALSSLMVAQAIPLVGELVDIGFAAYNFVESIINLFQVVHNSYNRPAYSPGHKTQPFLHDGYAVSWNTVEDSIIRTGFQGESGHDIKITAENTPLPIAGVLLPTIPGKLDVNKSKTHISVNGRKIRMRCRAIDGDVTFCRPKSPVYVGNGVHANLHVAFHRSSSEKIHSNEISSDSIGVLGYQKTVDHTKVNSKLSLFFEIKS
ncbi:diphtheria toxin [Corynebacterium diphtheriae]|uniref:diphtheria toxin n=1 Tax=Corynebacterium diphtheriae TaxID=1717 RepID=UPI0013CA9533|nr:diphtheria toxin [Corynebacterium diphtheriae]MBG9343654.1 diphtheria toxin [Corynebacterium diphtheriae]CAB0765587.1 toxin [Corynebacterium diphtheriae]CAB0847300.1 toxin [Corynebacterium diphtheriae]